MTEANEPALPINVVYDKRTAKGFEKDTKSWMGLTKREYFAAMAMQGLMVNKNFALVSDNEKVAARSVRMADALIKALNETNTKP